MLEHIPSTKEIIEDTEMTIDEDLPVYLITWSPDPKQLPDCHFEYQHRYNIDILVLFLKSCYTGLFCVETSMMGSPHYHGWFQTDKFRNEERIAITKVLHKLGMLRITQAKTYKINKYYEQANALYYYKKDIDAMSFIVDNPITLNSTCGIHWDMTHFFDSTVNAKHIANVVSEKQRLIDFYRDSSID